MQSLFVRISSGLAFSLILAAQTPAPAGGVIGGVVLDASRQPIRRAIVTLSTIESDPQEAVAWTDTEGRFAFGYLPAGRYELRVAKEGYQSIAYGTDSSRRPPGIIALAAGETRTGFVFRMAVMAIISGVVTDEDGDPLARVQISALKPGWRRGKRQFLPATSAVSDGSGRYQLLVQPGTYIIGVVRQFGDRAARSDVSAGQTMPRSSYVPRFYPGVERSDTATPLTVEPGQEYDQIDFQLRAQVDLALEGKVVPPPGMTAPAAVYAIHTDSEGQITQGAGVGPDLAFHFELLPGAYQIVATAAADGHSYRGVQSIDAGSEGARNLTVALEPGTDLSGTVSVEGPGAANFHPAAVGLVPGDNLPWQGQPLRANVRNDGSFTITGVPPGIWDINVSPVPPAGYIKSMRLGDQDVLTEEMAIDSSTKAPLKIVLGTRAAAVEGDVRAEGQAGRAVVLLAPELKYRRVFSFYRSAVTDDRGHFEFKNVTPGTYQLFAFDEFDSQSIQDPEFLKPFEREGVPLVLNEGENRPHTLTKVLSVNPQPSRSGAAQ